jgi:hypothetical protein
MVGLPHWAEGLGECTPFFLLWAYPDLAEGQTAAAAARGERNCFPLLLAP